MRILLAEDERDLNNIIRQSYRQTATAWTAVLMDEKRWIFYLIRIMTP